MMSWWLEEDESRTPWAALTALMVVATILRVIGLNRDLWLDEVYTLILTVRRPLWEILTLFPGDNQHMFYSVLARISVVLFGEHPWTVRLPSVVFGVGAVPALYFLARELTTRREALLAATLLTVSYHHVWFSQDARGYTGLLFWTLLCTTYLLRGLRSTKRSNWMAYAVAAALGTYTHLTMVFVVASHAAICAWLLLFPPKNEKYRVADWKLPAMGMTLAAVFTLVLYSPVVLQVQQFFSRPSKLEGISTPAWAFWETLRGLRIGLGAESGVVVAGVLFLDGAGELLAAVTSGGRGVRVARTGDSGGSCDGARDDVSAILFLPAGLRSGHSGARGDGGGRDAGRENEPRSRKAHERADMGHRACGDDDCGFGCFALAELPLSEAGLWRSNAVCRNATGNGRTGGDGG